MIGIHMGKIKGKPVTNLTKGCFQHLLKLFSHHLQYKSSTRFASLFINWYRAKKNPAKRKKGFLFLLKSRNCSFYMFCFVSRGSITGNKLLFSWMQELRQGIRQMGMSGCNLNIMAATTASWLEPGAGDINLGESVTWITNPLLFNPWSKLIILAYECCVSVLTSALF